MLNREEFEFLGITKFHKLGYTGKNITIVSKESVLKNIFEDVECNDFFDGKSDSAKHGTNVMDYIRQVVPDARKIATSLPGKVVKNIWYCDDMEMLLANPPDILTSSNYSTSDSAEHHMIKYKELRDKGCFLVSGAGNDGEDGVLDMVKNDVFKAIGMCRYNDGVITRAKNSSIGPEVDFMSLDNLYATWDNKKHKGTSFASPLFAGMIALVQDFFFDKTGKKLNHENLQKFVIDNCVDLEDEGHDHKTGYGLFILPDPEKINVEDYMEKKIVLKIDSNVARVNGIEKGLDAPATILNNRTMVPLRFIAEELGCKVMWDEENREVVIEK